MKTSHGSILWLLVAALFAHARMSAQSHAVPPDSPTPPAHRVIEEISVELNQPPDAPAPSGSHAPKRIISEVRTVSTANNPMHQPGVPANVIGVVNWSGSMDHSGQALQIRTQEYEPDSFNQLDEDLTVMSRILEKATQTEPTSGPRAMGIDLMTAPMGGRVRSLFLENYGVLFLINANIQLLPLPIDDQDQSEQSRPEKTSTWESTRRELYGSPAPPEPVLPLGWIGEPQGPLAYDADQVAQLRRTLIDALKNASNIRHLQPDAWVTICLQGAAATPLAQARREVVYGAGRNTDHLLLRQLGALDSASQVRKPARSVMTLQARKADIDQFAHNELSADEFADKVRTQTYLSNSNWDRTLLWRNR